MFLYFFYVGDKHTYTRVHEWLPRRLSSINFNISLIQETGMFSNFVEPSFLLIDGRIMQLLYYVFSLLFVPGPVILTEASLTKFAPGSTTDVANLFSAERFH